MLEKCTTEMHSITIGYSGITAVSLAICYKKIEKQWGQIIFFTIKNEKYKVNEIENKEVNFKGRDVLYFTH